MTSIKNIRMKNGEQVFDYSIVKNGKVEYKTIKVLPKFTDHNNVVHVLTPDNLAMHCLALAKWRKHQSKVAIMKYQQLTPEEKQLKAEKIKKGILRREARMTEEEQEKRKAQYIMACKKNKI